MKKETLDGPKVAGLNHVQFGLVDDGRRYAAAELKSLRHNAVAQKTFIDVIDGGDSGGLVTCDVCPYQACDVTIIVLEI